MHLLYQRLMHISTPRNFKTRYEKEDWPRTHMFASLDLRTGEIKWIPIFYPPIFKEEYDNIAGGYGFSYDYNYKENRLVCGFSDMTA